VSSDGRVYSASIQTLTVGAETYNRVNYDVVTSSFASMFDLISESITGSLTDQQLIRTRFVYERYDEFKISTGSVTFRRNNFVPFRGTQPTGQVGALDPFIIDRQLSHLENFQFLAPVYFDDSNIQQNLGNYDPVEVIEPLTYNELLTSLIGTDPQSPLKEKQVIDFAQTSLQSNVFMQIFEGTTTDNDGVSMLKKLDCIDFGEFKDENDKQRPFKRVFFVGKVYANENSDNYQSPAFVNLFTIVAE